MRRQNQMDCKAAMKRTIKALKAVTSAGMRLSKRRQPEAEMLIIRAFDYHNKASTDAAPGSRGALNHNASCKEALQMSKPLARARLQRY